MSSRIRERVSHAAVVDAVVAAVLFAVAVLERQPFQDGRSGLVSVVAVALMTLPLAARRAWPAVAAASFAAGMLVETLLAVPLQSVGAFAAGLLNAYTLAARGRSVAAKAAAGGFVAAVVLFLVRDPETPSALAALPTVVLLAAAAGIGYAVRRRDHEARQFAATAAAAERRRIARDLHDLVGHAVGLMVVQAGTGRLALDLVLSWEAPARKMARETNLPSMGIQSLRRRGGKAESETSRRVGAPAYRIAGSVRCCSFARAGIRVGGRVTGVVPRSSVIPARG
jgi:signal transduction histidine kinase